MRSTPRSANLDSAAIAASVFGISSWKLAAVRRRIPFDKLYRYRSLTRIRQVIAILVAGSVLHAGPVAAYLCMTQPMSMASCCPDSPNSPDSVHQHGSHEPAPQPDALTFCCPDGEEALPAASPDLPDPVFVIAEIVTVVDVTGRDQSLPIAHVRPWAQGPPIYLATRRLRN